MAIPDEGAHLGAAGKFTTDDLLALQAMAPLLAGFAPWTTYSIRPVALMSVLVEIVVHERRSVLEMGCGASTLAIAGQLARDGTGRVVAVEHDQTWAHAIGRLLAQHGLTEHATIVHAPLAPTPLSADGSLWYSTDVVAGLRDDRYDLLLVDGPPAGPKGGMSRAPALPWFERSLAPDALVVLDDVGRPGEDAVLERWEESGRWVFERLPYLGIAMASARGEHLHW